MSRHSCHCPSLQLMPLSLTPTHATVPHSNSCHCPSLQLMRLSLTPTHATVPHSNSCHCPSLMAQCVIALRLMRRMPQLPRHMPTTLLRRQSQDRHPRSPVPFGHLSISEARHQDDPLLFKPGARRPLATRNIAPT